MPLSVNYSALLVGISAIYYKLQLFERPEDIFELSLRC